MEARRVTIKDVAMAIGVTPQTVSRVFRGKGYVSADTRLKVLDAAERLKYVPNSAAIRLRTGETRSIAVVFDSLMNVYFSIMVDYLHKEVQRHGYNIQTIFVNSHTIGESVYREALSLGVSAVISFLEPDPSLVDIVRDYGVPLMILGRRAEADIFDYITTDDVMGGELAARKLISSGCGSFGFLATAFGMTCVKDRAKGFFGALEANGRKGETIDCGENVRSAFERYAEHKPLPEGLFCFSDMIAYDAIKALNGMGIAGVKIVGYDNIQADIPMPINLSTVGVDKPKFVELIVGSLLDKIEGRTKDRIARSVSVILYDGETA